MIIQDLGSSAIQELIIDGNSITIIFVSNLDKEYKYQVKNEDILITIFKTIVNKSSLGRLITNMIKSGDLIVINTENTWLQRISNSKMSKTSRNYNQSSKNKEFVDDYEDFGYKVKNARRYQTNKKRTPKFKDYNDYEDTNWSVHYLLTDDQNDVLYVSRQEFSNVWWTLVWNSGHARWDLWNRRFQSWCKGSLSDCLRAWCQTPWNPQRLINMNQSDLFTLKENYANLIVDGMDIDTLAQFAYDSIMDNLKDYEEQDLEAEITDLYGEETYNDLADVDDIKVTYGETMNAASWGSGTQGVVFAPFSCIL